MMMKILTRIAVVILLAAGVYFLREANINKTNISTEPVVIETEEVQKKKALELKFEEEKKEKREALKERIEALRKNSQENIKSVAVTRIALTEVPKTEMMSLKEIEREVEEIVKESKITPIKIFLYEWELDISDRTIPEGKILFEVHNDGWFSHDFGIKDGENFGKVFPGEIAFFLTDHLEVGEYEVYSPKLIDEMHHIAENFTIE